MPMKQVQQKSVREWIDIYFANNHSMQEILDRFKNTVLFHALVRCEGNISKAAVLLHTHRNTIQRWMNRFHLDRKDFLPDERKVSAESQSLQGGVESERRESGNRGQEL